MATQLSPELLAILRAQQGSRTGYTDGAQNYNSLASYGEGDNSQTQIGGGGWGVDAVGSDPRSGMYQEYDPSGNYVADRLKHKDKSMQDFTTFLGGALGAYGIGSALTGGLGALGGAAGPGMPGWGLDLGIDAASGSLGNAAAASSGAVGPGMAGWGADLGMAGTAGTVGLPAAAGGTTVGGLLSKLGAALPSGAGSYLGPAATIIGGLLGAKGNEQSSTTTKSLDPRIDPLIYGQGGLSGKVQDLLNRQTSQTGLLGKYWK